LLFQEEEEPIALGYLYGMRINVPKGESRVSFQADKFTSLQAYNLQVKITSFKFTSLQV
jgi:hypothetical protein